MTWIAAIYDAGFEVTPGVIQAAVAVLGVVGTWILVAYFAGRLTKSQEATEATVAEQGITLKEHGAKLELHGEKLVKIEEFNRGFELGRQMVSNTHIDVRS